MKPLKIYLTLAWICGFYPVSQPFAEPKRGFTTKRFVVIIFSIIFTVFPVILTADMLISTKLKQVIKKPTLSSTIISYALVLSDIAVNAAVRIYSCLNAQTLWQLTEILRSLDIGCERRIKKWRLRYLMTLCGVVLVLIHVGAGIEQLSRNQSRLGNMPLKTLPESQTVRIIASQFHNICITSANIFATSFVVVFGSILVQEYHTLCLQISGYISSDKFLNTFDPDHYEWQKHNFMKLKQCFRLYGKMAGVYIVFSMYYIFVVVISSFSTLTSDGFQRIDNIQYSICSIVVLYFLASFGEYLHGNMEDGRELISDALGRWQSNKITKEMRASLDQLAQWVLRWRWKLTAMNCFTINNSILPAMAGTVMTYYIFFFQLMLSEK